MSRKPVIALLLSGLLWAQEKEKPSPLSAVDVENPQMVAFKPPPPPAKAEPIPAAPAAPEAAEEPPADGNSKQLSAVRFTQRGFLETTTWGFPKEAANGDAQAIAESRFRYDVSLNFAEGWRIFGSFDARVDTRTLAARSGAVNFDDRTLYRPALSLRRYSLQYSKGMWTVEVGRQFIRWGKTDILTPTDRFAPRDFMMPFSSEFLGVLAGRVTFDTGSFSVDAVFSPELTPSRIPLLNQRWTVLPPGLDGVPLTDLGALYPSGPQYGLRLHKMGRGYEVGVMAYRGFNHLPLFEGQLVTRPLSLGVRRFYPQLSVYGADFAVPTSWFTIKGETAWFRSTTPQSDEYVQYVVQLERSAGEWYFVGGYAGEAVTLRRAPVDFAPDRGLTEAFLGRAQYQIDANRSIAFEAAVRQNANGYYGKAEYSQAFGQHWRVIGAVILVRGTESDFLGQFQGNSYAVLIIRYSF